MSLPNLEISIPRRQEIKLPSSQGPSKFPHSVDELKTIEYSSVPAGGQLEKDLHQYYSILASVASNSATEQDLYTLKSLMLKVRSYVLTEDDFNLMSDAVRTTQEYLREAIKAADGNFELVSSIADTLVSQMNAWSEALEKELQKLAVQKNLGAPVIYGANNPGPSALGYLWIDDSATDDAIAPIYDPEGRLTTFHLGDMGLRESDYEEANKDVTDREIETFTMNEGSELHDEEFS